jgi:hypothetical protein
MDAHPYPNGAVDRIAALRPSSAATNSSKASSIPVSMATASAMTPQESLKPHPSFLESVPTEQLIPPNSEFLQKEQLIPPASHLLPAEPSALRALHAAKSTDTFRTTFSRQPTEKDFQPIPEDESETSAVNMDLHLLHVTDGLTFGGEGQHMQHVSEERMTSDPSLRASEEEVLRALARVQDGQDDVMNGGTEDKKVPSRK